MAASISAVRNVTPVFANTHIVSYRQEVVDLLNQVAARQARAVVTFADGAMELTAKLAHINLHFDEIILAEPSVTAVPPLAPDAVTILSGNHKLQFHVDHIERTVFDDKVALRVRLPKMLFCSERRERTRVSPPLDQSLRCLVPDGASKQIVELPVIDISTGGLALMAHPLKIEVHVGKELLGCRLALPQVGDTSFSLVIRSITEASQAVEGRRCGCQFSEIGSEAMALVERYVELHRERS